MAFVFASTTPLGIVIGLAIQTTYDAQSPKALILAGVFDAISSGKRPPSACIVVSMLFSMLFGQQQHATLPHECELQGTCSDMLACLHAQQRSLCAAALCR